MPGEPSEPTSTIVLTSKDSYFVDIRIFNDGDVHEKSVERHEASRLQWAFAGRSHNKSLAENEAKAGLRSHTVWDHWIESKDDDPAPDEGDMTLLEDGTVLEEGSGTDPVSGEVTKYEELWKDLPVEPSGSNQERDCIVLHTVDDERRLQGVVIKIGKWCQGIMKARGALAVERWSANSGPYGAYIGESETRSSQPGEWVRTFRVGQQSLPCEALCRGTPVAKGDKTFKFDDIEWQVLENWHW